MECLIQHVKTGRRIVFIILLTRCLYTFCQKDSYSMCRTAADCGENHCCAAKLKGSKFGFCMPAKGLGEQCSGNYLYGMSYTCGCQTDLTCALVEKNYKTNYGKYRCVQVLADKKENSDNGRNKTTALLSAIALTRLLNIYGKNPRLRKT